MSGVKPWQIVLIVAAVVGIGASLYLTMGRSDSVPMASEMLLVDITTGDLYSMPLTGHRAIVTPAKNPDTGKICLFPVHKNEAGAWFVSTRDLGALPVVQGEPKALIDRKSGEVRVTSETPRRLPS